MKLQIRLRSINKARTDQGYKRLFIEAEVLDKQAINLPHGKEAEFLSSNLGEFMYLSNLDHFDNADVDLTKVSLESLIGELNRRVINKAFPN